MLGLYCCFTANKPGIHHAIAIPILLAGIAGVWCAPVYYFSNMVSVYIKITQGLPSGAETPPAATWCYVGLAMTCLDVYAISPNPPSQKQTLTSTQDHPPHPPSHLPHRRSTHSQTTSSTPRTRRLHPGPSLWPARRSPPVPTTTTTLPIPATTHPTHPTHPLNTLTLHRHQIHPNHNHLPDLPTHLPIPQPTKPHRRNPPPLRPPIPRRPLATLPRASRPRPAVGRPVLVRGQRSHPSHAGRARYSV